MVLYGPEDYSLHLYYCCDKRDEAEDEKQRKTSEKTKNLGFYTKPAKPKYLSKPLMAKVPNGFRYEESDWKRLKVQKRLHLDTLNI